MKVYKVVKGKRHLGLRRGQYVIAYGVPKVSFLGAYHPSTIWVGRLKRVALPAAAPRRFRKMQTVWVQDGDRAWSFEEAPQGWGEYAYTHGGRVFRARCGLAHALWKAQWPDQFTFEGAVLVAAPSKETQQVIEAFERPSWE